MPSGHDKQISFDIKKQNLKILVCLKVNIYFSFKRNLVLDLFLYDK